MRQRRIVLHLVVQSTALILLILICMIIGARLVRRLMSHPLLERRQTTTLRMILDVSVQVLGVVLILFVVFEFRVRPRPSWGLPRQRSPLLCRISSCRFWDGFAGWASAASAWVTGWRSTPWLGGG